MTDQEQERPVSEPLPTQWFRVLEPWDVERYCPTCEHRRLHRTVVRNFTATTYKTVCHVCSQIHPEVWLIT